MRIRIHRLLIAATLLTACSEPLAVVPEIVPGFGDGPAITIPVALVAPGAAFSAQVLNNDDVPASYGQPCNALLERRDGADWQTVWDQRQGSCVQAVYSIPAKNAVHRPYDAPMVDGTYRLRMFWTGDRVSVSNSFDVGGDAAVRIEVVNDAVDDGANVGLRFDNRSQGEWGYNTCAAGRVQRRVGDVWVGTGEPTRICTMSLQMLGARDTETVHIHITEGTPAGTYRFVQGFSNDQVSIIAASGSFTVR